jgi:hypothetical protein
MTVNTDEHVQMMDVIKLMNQIGSNKEQGR